MQCRFSSQVQKRNVPSWNLSLTLFKLSIFDMLTGLVGQSLGCIFKSCVRVVITSASRSCDCVTLNGKTIKEHGYWKIRFCRRSFVNSMQINYCSFVLRDSVLTFSNLLKYWLLILLFGNQNSSNGCFFCTGHFFIHNKGIARSEVIRNKINSFIL